MMINILSLRSSLAFAPYLADSLAEFLANGEVPSQVVRQGGRGLILRSDGNLVLRHEHRQASLGREEARHYAATIRMRSECYNVSRMQDEVVLADAGEELLLSHPQSEMWLTGDAVEALGKLFRRDTIAAPQREVSGFPNWLQVSTGGGSILLSDQRTARWVLLGEDHLRELEFRLAALRQQDGAVTAQAPPTICLKGLTVHLQSVMKLAQALDELSETGKVTPFEEITPAYSLKASRATEGLELSDSHIRVALTPREARKWVNIIRVELDRLKVRHVERGGIRTVLACDGHGRWILQWGDEVFIPKGEWPALASESAITQAKTRPPIAGRIDEFQMILNRETGSCVALTDSESTYLGRQDASDG